MSRSRKRFAGAAIVSALAVAIGVLGTTLTAADAAALWTEPGVQQPAVAQQIQDPVAPSVPNPTPAELTALVNRATSVNTSDAEKANSAVAGSAAVPIFNKAAAQRAFVSPPGSPEYIHFAVSDIDVNGNTATGILHANYTGPQIPGYGEQSSFDFDMDFRYLDGRWKLDRTAVCSIAQMSMSECTI
ncbi:hypothetical protein AB0H00_23190 [Nocardia sp. NPDC023852]|uniref:hypothetical protein n=1 Tax=Nocardia sp. NPDC023852 TaxID=3154697 RepID=UPI0033F60AB6